MFSRITAQQHPDRPAIVMASTGQIITHAEHEAGANRLAHALRRHGLGKGDHFALFMENNNKFLEICAAGERSGLYFTPINSYLTADELAYIVQNSQSQVLIVSKAKREIAAAALEQCPDISLQVMIDAGDDDPLFVDYESFVKDESALPISDENLGIAMLYSSGTTGRPKGILRPMPDSGPDSPLPLWGFLDNLWKYEDGMTYLSPAPMYHSAPQAAVGLTLRRGGTVVVMENFDPEQYLKLVEQYKITHSQLVPTMFSRMLKLPEEVQRKYDLSSLKVAVHAAAPCPVPVKEKMIEWWGPIIEEYYGATEGLGFAACDSAQWLAHVGTVGKVLIGELHILDDDMNPLPQGEPGTLWFKAATAFSYFNDVEKTKESTSADGVLTTVGDVGYLDADGYLFLTDRATFMIISGGVNIYPQESENLLITHPKVADAAVFGVPNVDLGEEVKGVVQLMPGIEASGAIERELIDFCNEHLARQKCPRSIDFCNEHLARQKCPRSIDFVTEFPRLPTGKLYKKPLRDKYWADKKSRIV